jgi:hypothetical protein
VNVTNAREQTEGTWDFASGSIWKLGSPAQLFMCVAFLKPSEGVVPKPERCFVTSWLGGPVLAVAWTIA